MSGANWPSLKQIKSWFHAEAQDVEQQQQRIHSMERNIILPIKGVVLAILVYYLYFSKWFEDEPLPRQLALELVQRFFLFYVALNVAVGSFLLGAAQLSIKLLQLAVVVQAFVDAVFLANLMVIAGGADSILFWFFPALIVRGSISIPVASLQILTNILVSLAYAFSGILDITIGQLETEVLDWKTVDAIQPPTWETAGEPLLLRLLLLLLVGVCCYGVQMLFDKRRRSEEESREFALRQQQLRVSGRLAGEIAHQLKNPLGIINNAAFNLQRNIREDKSSITQQIRIIREEVERSDRIITDLMGYARLAEGKIEKLEINQEVEAALEEVFPPNQFNVQIQRDYATGLPSLLMQRHHLMEVLTNLLLNSRQALNGDGHIQVQTSFADHSVVICIADNGPGIPSELHDKVFEPYFTTKEKGSGLGLAIVKHNTEMYDGTVQVNSDLGKGTQFVLRFPVRSLIKVRS
jgi:signal transduction histidine kinase